MTKQIIIITLIGCLQNFGTAQTRLYEVPKVATIDSVFRMIISYHNYSEEQVIRTQQFGLLQKSAIMNTDSFYQSTKQYCIQQVGEDFFYNKFRLILHSFENNPDGNVFTIKYRFYPFAVENRDYVDIVFKKMDFLNIHQYELPQNLPECEQEKENCGLLISREKAKEIAKKEVVKDRDLDVFVQKLMPSLKWKCNAKENDWSGESFYIDIKTGEITELHGWRRID